MTNIDYSIKDIENYVTVDGKINDVQVSRLTAPGENFISLVLRVDFEVEKDGQSKTYSTVAKRLPLGQGALSDFHAQSMINEIKWYTNIVPLLKKFAEEHEIVGVDFFPEYCGSRYSLNPSKKDKDIDADSFLLLENLIPQGFKNEDKREGFDFITTKAILKKLAIFHSVPIAMKFKRPDVFNIVNSYLDRTLPMIHGLQAGPENTILGMMIDMPECSSYVEKLKLQLEKPKGPAIWRTAGIEPWSTIIHTDFWGNNIMISSREGKEPLVKIVDFQMCRYGSFARDVVFFLLTSVKDDVTIEYMDDLLRFYYEEFTSVLTKAKVDLELTYTAYLKELQQAATEIEFNHVIFFTTPIFGEKLTFDPAVDEFDPSDHFVEMIKNMGQRQKNKLILLIREAASRNWI